MNTLNIPDEIELAGPKPSIPYRKKKSIDRGVSQYFHGTKRWGSFSKSTISRKKKNINNRPHEHNLCEFNQNEIITSSIDYSEDIDINSNKFCNFFNFLPIFHPVGPLKCCWDAMVMIILIYTSIEIPYTLSFNITLTLNSVFGVIALLIDICLCIDIILNFRTAYFHKIDHLKLIIDPTSIAKHYLKGWFIIDLITSFPFHFIVPQTNTTSNDSFDEVTTYIKVLRIFRLLRVIKIMRLFKMVKLFDGILKRIVVREMLIALRLLKIVAFMLLYSHLCACVWYVVGCESQKKYGISWISENTNISHDCYYDPSAINGEQLTPVFERYSYAWYWSVVTLFTTGYGDVCIQYRKFACIPKLNST